MAGLETSDSRFSTGKAVQQELPEDALSLIKAAGQSLLNSAIQEPLDGAAQLINHVVHRKIVPAVHLVKPPQQAEFGSKAWLAQSIGSGLGMILPFLLTEKATGMAFEKAGALAETLPLARSIVRPLTMSAEEANNAGKLARMVRFVAPSAKKAIDGAIFGAVFTPNAPDSKKGFWEQRGINAACSAITFGTMGLASEGLMTGAAKLKVPLADAAFRSSLPGIAFRLGVNGAGGVVGGFASAESNALLSGRGFASGQEIGQSMTSFLVTGAALDAFHMGAERISERRKSEPAYERVSAAEAEAIELKEGRHEVTSGTYEVSGNTHVIARGTAKVIARGDAVVEASEKARVSASDNVTVTARDGAKVTVLNSACVTALGGAEIWALGNSRVESKGINKITAYDKASIKANGKSQVDASGEIQVPEVNASGGAHVEAGDDVHVRVADHAHVDAAGQAKVYARDNATVTARDEVAVMAGGNASLNLYGKSQATISGSVHATAREDVSISAAGDAYVVATDRVSVQAGDRVHVGSHGNAKVSLGNEATAIAGGHSEVRAWGTSIVIAGDYAHVIANDRSTVELYDHSTADASKNSTIIKHDETAVVTAGGEARNYVPTLTPNRSSGVRSGTEKVPGSTAYVSEETYPDGSPIVSNFEKARDAVLQISTAQDTGGKLKPIGLGSGFFINEEGLIATAYHVVAEADHIEIVMPDGNKVEAGIIDVDPGADLALLQAKGRLPKINGFSIAAAGEPAVGMQTVVFGHPGGSRTMAASPGELAGIRRAVEYRLSPDEENADGRRLELTARTQPGNSGSPVIDLKTGRVVGVVSRGGENAGMTLAIPTDYLLPLLNATPEERSARLAGIGVREGAARQQKSPGILRTEQADAPQKVMILPDSMVAKNLVEPSTLTAVRNAHLREPELRLYRQALEQQAISSKQLEQLLSKASPEVRHAVQDIWLPSRLAGNNSSRFLALLDRVISFGNDIGSAGGSHAGDILDLRRQMAEQAFLYGRAEQLSIIISKLKPNVRLRLFDMLSHLAAERTSALEANPLDNRFARGGAQAIDDQLNFLADWLNQDPENRPGPESLAIFDRTVRRLKALDVDICSLFANIRKIEQQFGCSPLDAFNAEAVSRFAGVDSPSAGANLATISEFQEKLRARATHGVVDSRIETWRGLREIADSKTISRIDEHNRLVASLVDAVDADMIEQFSREDAQWYAGKMRERLNSMLEKGGVRNTKRFFENIDKITEGRVGQTLSKEFATDLVKALEKQGLSSEEISSAVRQLTERKPFLSISGLSQVFDGLAEQLRGEYADFVHPVRRRTKMCPCINALVFAEPGEGPCLTYQFHKSTETHFNLYRMAADPDGTVILISPNGERAAISQVYGQLRAEKLAWDGRRNRWIATGERVDLPRLVLFEDPNAQAALPQNNAIRNKLIQLQQKRNLLVPEELVGSLHAGSNGEQKAGFERGVNYFDIALAQADGKGMTELAKKLAQQVRASRRSGARAKDLTESTSSNPIEEIQSAAFTAEHNRTEARLLRSLYEQSGKEKQPDRKAAIVMQEAELFAKNVSYRTVDDLVKLSRQLHEELRSKHNDEELLYVVLEDEGSAHFIHEVFRKANKLDASQFITQADALRLASRGALNGKRLVLLDDNFDYGSQCIEKLNICLDASRRERESGKGNIDGVTIASLISFEDEAERIKQIDEFRESDSPKGTKPHKTAELFDIDTISSEYSSPLKERPDLLPSQRRERRITRPSFASGTNKAGAAEMWPHLMPSNCAECLVDFAKELGHFPTRVFSEYYLYRPLIDALPDYFRATSGRNLRLEDRAQLLADAFDHSLTMQENGGNPAWGEHDFLRNQLKSARLFVDALRSAIEKGDRSKLEPLVNMADSWYRKVDATRRPAIAQLKADELKQDALKFDGTERTQTGHSLTYEFQEETRPTIQLPSGETVRILSLKVNDGALSLNYCVGSSEQVETESVKSAAEGRIVPLLLEELRSSDVKGALAENNYANGHMLAAYLDKIAQFASTSGGAADGEARKKALAKLQEDFKKDDKQPLTLVFAKTTHRRFNLNYKFAGEGVSLELGNQIVRIGGLQLEWADVGKEPPGSKKKRGGIELIDGDGKVIPNNDNIVETLLDEIKAGYMVRLVQGNKAAQAQILAAYLDRLCKPVSPAAAPAFDIDGIALALVGD